MTEQLDMLDLMRAPPILRPVDPDGPVIQADVDELLRLPHRRLAWDMAAIELHRHEDGLWMWGVKHACGGYRVGPKWGKFAETRDDALHYAARELLDKTRRTTPEGSVLSASELRQIEQWAEGLL